MKTANIQNAIAFTKFHIVKCNLESSASIVSEDIANLDIEFKFATGFNDSNTKLFVVEFIISIKTKETSKLSLTVKATSFFKTQNVIDDTFKNSSFVKLNAPAIAFPFLRSFIQTLCVNAGIPPIILPAFNFENVIEELVNDN